MKIQVDIKDKLKENDMLVFDSKYFRVVNREVLLKPLRDEIRSLEERVSALEQEINTIKGV